MILASFSRIALSQIVYSKVLIFTPVRVITALSVVMGVDLSGGDEGPAAPAAPPSAAKQAGGAEASPPPKQPASKPKDVPLTDDVKEALRLKDLGNDAYKAKNFDDALEVRDQRR